MKIVDGVMGEEGSEAEEAAKLTWARDVAARKAVLFHLAFGVLGRASAAYAPGEFMGPNGRPVTAAVVVLEDGSSSIADPKAFAELTPEAAALAEKVSEKIGAALRWGFILANHLGVDEESTLKILGALLQAQTVRLRASSDVLEEVTAALERSRAVPPEGRQTGAERGGGPIPPPEGESPSPGRLEGAVGPFEGDWPVGFRKGET